MIEVRKTPEFDTWLAGLKDTIAKQRVSSRVRQLAFGLMGDIEPVGEGVSELRIHTGPGYRVYIVQRGQQLIVVLGGGDKRSQQRDIAKAKALAEGLK
jgi:putative addiction module killer protein